MGLSWSDAPTASSILDNYAYRGVEATELGILLAFGGDSFGNYHIVASSDAGATWAELPGYPGGSSAPPEAIGWNGSRLVLAVGIISGGAPPYQLYYSDDGGATWTPATTSIPFEAYGAYPSAVAWCPAQSRWVVGGLGSTGPVIFSSPDGDVWTAETTPFDGDGVNSGGVNALSTDPLTGNTVAVGTDVLGAKNVMSSSDLSSWTARTAPADPSGGQYGGVAWLPVAGLFFATGYQSASSPTGTTWSPVSTPLDGGYGYESFETPAGSVALLGYDVSDVTSIYESTDLSAWTDDAPPWDPGAGCYGGYYATGAGVAVALGFSSGSIKVMTAPGAAVAPSAPTQHAAVSGNAEATISWTAGYDGGSAITGYNVYRGLTSGGETLLTALGVVSSFLDTGLTNGTEYFYEVTAVNAIGESAVSNEESVTPGTIAPPDAPTLDSLAADVSEIELAWTAGSDGGSPIVGYEVWRGTTSGGEIRHALVGDVTSYLDPATPGITYFYEVKAVNAGGTSSPSNELSAEAEAPTPFPRHVVVVKIYDLDTVELADISGICLAKSLKRRLSQARQFVVQCPAASTLLTSVVSGDGLPNLLTGNRKLLVWEDGTIIFHGRIDTIERNGDGTQNLVTVTAVMPIGTDLGYDSADRAGRPVRGSTTQPTAGLPYANYDGNYVNPLFASSITDQVGISGPDLILQALTNSRGTDTEGTGSPGEGPLPISLTGDFDLDVPDAVNLSCLDYMSWPILCGDFIQQIVSTGVCDIDERPLDPSETLSTDDPYLMSELKAVSALGTDRSDTVHFDYFTGSNNASACRHLDDFATICNKLYDYLGPPRPGGTRFTLGNITPGSPGTTVDPSASRARYGAGPSADPDAVHGQFMTIRITDWQGSAGAARPLAIALWNAEQGDRVIPRGMLYITPSPDVKALWEAPADYDVGDLVSVNVGADFGLTIATVQRVYGYDKSWDDLGVATISGLITSAAEE